MLLGSVALEVSIGLILTFLLVSLILAAVVESVEAYLKSRALHLELAIAELLHDQDGNGLRSQFYTHPLIAALYPGNYKPTAFDKDGKVLKGVKDTRHLPTYIPREHFSSALLDLARDGSLDTSGTPGAKDVSKVVLAAIALAGSGKLSDPNNPHVAEALESLQSASLAGIRNVRRELEGWYDGAMDRASGWYRRRTQLILFLLGLGVALLLNVNAIIIGQALATTSALREAVSDFSESTVNQYRLPAAPTIEEAETTTRTVSSAEVNARISEAGGDEGKASVDNKISRSTSGQQILGNINNENTGEGEDRIAETDHREEIKPDALAQIIQDSVLALNLPIGRSRDVQNRIRHTFYSEEGVINLLQSLVLLSGYLITAFAATLGAPFWFDVLNKLIVIRSTVKPKEKSPDEKSEDRQ